MKTELENTLKALQSGATILYPTDTVWGLGCDATNKEAVAKLFDLKKRPNHKAMICLVSDIRMLEKYIYEVPDIAYDLIEASEKPLTIIYDKPIGLAKNLIGTDNTLAVRVTSDGFCQQLIRKFKRPLVSTSANLSGAPTPRSSKEISTEILKGVDYVVNLQEQQNTNTPSTIIKIGSGGLVKIIRK